MTNRPRFIRDFLILCFIAVVSFILAGHFDLLEAFIEFSHQHEDMELDELFTTGVILSVALTGMTTLRSMQLSKQIQLRLAAEKKVKALAFQDPLTNLPNRRLFLTELDFATKLACREKQKQAVIFIDIDDFKQINDTYGHAAGDEVLCQLAKRIQGCIRDNDILARIAGDEFALLLTNIKDPHDASIVCEKILPKISEPVSYQEEQFKITLSIGIAITPDDSNEPDELISYADKAMYSVKRSGKNNYQYFSQQLNSLEQRKSKILGMLKLASVTNELYLEYQPIYNQSMKIIKLEALARWQNSELGSVSPAEFIPLAETNGLISDITDRVVNKTCLQMQTWQTQGVSLPVISINISGIDISDPDFADRMKRLLKSSGISPELIEFEITETAIMQDVEISIINLTKLREFGFSLAIDDFGVKHSSMSYLVKLPVQTLKIDQMFVHNIEDSEQGKLIYEAIIALGKTLGLKVVTEGVETESQAKAAKKFNSDALQGFHYCKPLSVEDVTDKLRQS